MKMKECVDFYRYFETDKLSDSQFRRLAPELKWLYYFRILQNKKGNDIIHRLYYKYFHLRFNRMREKTQIQIPYNAKIGTGFYIGHTGRVIINPDVIIGENVNVGTGVTIGSENRGKRKGVPVISNRVWIGTNAVIVGKIVIEEDVLIAPNAYVNFNVPAHSIVIGNPAKIIRRNNATEGYINKEV